MPRLHFFFCDHDLEDYPFSPRRPQASGLYWRDYVTRPSIERYTCMLRNPRRRRAVVVVMHCSRSFFFAKVSEHKSAPCTATLGRHRACLDRYRCHTGSLCLMRSRSLRSSDNITSEARLTRKEKKREAIQSPAATAQNQERSIGEERSSLRSYSALMENANVLMLADYVRKAGGKSLRVQDASWLGRWTEIRAAAPRCLQAACLAPNPPHG